MGIILIVYNLYLAFHVFGWEIVRMNNEKNANRLLVLLTGGSLAHRERAYYNMVIIYHFRTELMTAYRRVSARKTYSALAMGIRLPYINLLHDDFSKRVWRTGTSACTPNYMSTIFSCPCLWYLILALHSSDKLTPPRKQSPMTWTKTS